MPFVEAMARLFQQKVMPTNMSSEELSQLNRDVIGRSFFSARNTLENVLEFEKKKIMELVNPHSATRTLSDGTVESYTEGTNQGYIRAEIKLMLERTGYQPDPGKRGTIQDLSSDQRIDLVIETNRKIAQAYGQNRQSQNADALDAIPADELIRTEDREVPREWQSRWQTAGDASGREDGWGVYGGRMIAQRNHPIWDRLGDALLFPDGLGNPFPPFAFGSGMDVTGVRRDEAVELGVIGENEMVMPTIPSFALDSDLLTQ
jgi:hypothetical protein